MNSRKSSVYVALLLLPSVSLLVGTSAANDVDRSDRITTPDLVITEDTRIALQGRKGKAVIGSCEFEAPLWEGKIAIKNIGSAPVEVEDEDEVDRDAALPRIGADAEAHRREVRERRSKLPPHVRVYVPNNIELQAQDRLSHTLDEFGQELVYIEIGRRKNKCRNYDAPPVFDERVAGNPGPLSLPPPPIGGYGWQIKRIQEALMAQGYHLTAGADGDYGPQTARAVVAFFKDHNQPPPPGIFRKPLAPETVSLLLEALKPEEAGEQPTGSPGPIGGGDECIRGVNIVPVYIEIDPERKIEGENRSNNRVQFTVAIDCSNIAK